MNSLLVTLIIIALYLAYALVLLLIRALIVRTDIYRRWAQSGHKYSRPRVIQNLHPQPTINVMPASAPNWELLQRLAKTEPLPLGERFDRTRVIEARLTVLSKA